MTELEAANLKVGDMVLYYSLHAHEACVYVEEVRGKTYGVDMGLVLESDGTHIRIDWFAEEGRTVYLADCEIWGQVEKA